MGPLDGTATMTKDDVARFGVMVYRTGISAYGANYTATLIGDGNFNALTAITRAKASPTPGRASTAKR